jgi:uncharacterized protein (DUF1697 family)
MTGGRAALIAGAIVAALGFGLIAGLYSAVRAAGLAPTDALSGTTCAVLPATIRAVDRYLALLRGINVGGRNRIPMADLKQAVEDLGYNDVGTFIQSGNVLFDARGSAESLASALEAMLPRRFQLDSGEIMVLVLTHDRLASIVNQAPPGFGEEPHVYKYDVAFLKGVTGDEILAQVRPHPEVDAVWAEPDAVYYRRLTSRLSQSRMSRLITTPVYRYMTIRNWNTATKLLALMDERACARSRLDA